MRFILKYYNSEALKDIDLLYILMPLIGPRVFATSIDIHKATLVKFFFSFEGHLEAILLIKEAKISATR